MAEKITRTNDGSSTGGWSDNGDNMSGELNRIQIVDDEDNEFSDITEINIETVTGKILFLNVKSSDTIGSLKIKIHDEEHIPFEQQELFLNEKILANINTLANLHITNECTLKMMQKSVEMMEIFVITFTGKTISLSVHPQHTIFHVKSMVWQKENIPHEEQALIFNDVVLGDSGTLFDFRINTKSTLTLMRKLSAVIKLYIQTFDGETLTLWQVKPSDTIESIKTEIEDSENIPCDEQVLIFNGIILHNNDTDTLADFHITKESTLKLMRLSSGFMRIPIKIPNGKTLTLDVKPSYTIYKVKVEIYDQVGIRPCEQRLILNGKQLLDAATLADYDISKESIIYVMLSMRGC